MGRVVHFEMHVDDPERAAAFYENVFGWKFEKWDGPEDYWMISTGEKETMGIDGGMMRRTDPAGSTYNTLAVEDLDDCIKQVNQMGGEIVVPKMAVPGFGWLAYFKDTESNIFGMMQHDSEAK